MGHMMAENSDHATGAEQKVATRRHARSGLEFSELALGTARWGEAAGPEGDAASAETFDLAWAAGIRYYDTAPFYGTGLCEARLGASLRWKPRADYLLSTKVGIDLDPHGRRGTIPALTSARLPFGAVCDYSARGIASSFEGSLNRMGVLRADMAFMHGISVCPGGMEAALATGSPALIGLRDQGLVKLTGVGANTPAIAMAFLERHDLDALLFAGGLSIFDHAKAREVVTLCRARDIAIIGASPFGNGQYFAPETAEFRARLAEVRQKFGVSENAAAVQFSLLLDCVVTVLWSTKTPEYIGGTLDSYAEPIPPEFWQACVAHGLVQPWVLEND